MNSRLQALAGMGTGKAYVSPGCSSPSIRNGISGAMKFHDGRYCNPCFPDNDVARNAILPNNK